MSITLAFIINSIMLGFGLAMDAFSVSLANGLNDINMKKTEMCRIAGCFAFFQWFMPMAGWVCIHTIVLYFESFQMFIPWIALILLSYIGGKMILEGIKKKENDAEPGTTAEGETEDNSKLANGTLIIQGIATSIDALSVGFTIANYHFSEALLCSVLIAVTTFIICIIGLKIGRAAGTKLSNKADILGGVILIGIGLEILISNIF
ncbi:manganese efflux pump MntP [Oribacterium sp. P6A1]|uniref:manganese efflux pump MntP n=1 Tax=Oribacterium sp. P6A1 TaxID=1410612 RepID=UPI00055F31D7|nr:manganese efflux pump MntP family protein [Oribacterium sp. P6A1]